MPTDLLQSRHTTTKCSASGADSEGIPVPAQQPESSPSTISLSSHQEDSEVEPQANNSSATCPFPTPSKLPHSRRSPEGLNGNIGSRRGGIDLNVEDVSFLPEVGRGYGGIVCKIQHKATGYLMIRKTFELDIKTSVRAQILRDLLILCECSSPFIPTYFGAFYEDKSISLCMEYMDAGGLDTLLPKVGRFPEPIVVRIAESVCNGLVYLWQELHIMHRNLKPSNILISRSGAVKVSDFVVSLPLSDVLAGSFMATRIYLAPERIVGEPFNTFSDVWSLGLTLMELAIGCYPFPALDPVDFVRSFAPELGPNMEEHWRATKTGEALPSLGSPRAEPLTIFELVTHITERPPPRVAAYCFSPKFVHLMHSCLRREPTDRLSLEVLHGHVLPSFATLTDRNLGDVSLANYLNGVFAREQAEAIDAVVLAVGDELDVTGEEPSLSSGAVDSWTLPLSSGGIQQFAKPTNS